MAENYILLETIQLSQAASSVTFDNIPQTGYTDLKIVGSARSTYSGGYVALRVNPNGSTSNATSTIAYGSGTSVDAFTDTIIYSTINANTATSNTFGNFEIYCPNYTASAHKSFATEAVTEDNASTALSMLVCSNWADNSAITSLYLAPTVGNFMAGSTFSIYGVAALGTTPITGPFASGGNIVANDGTYWYHAFLSSGNFVPQTPITCDVLVVAGGGGVSTNSNGVTGGGGAGGVIYFANQSLVSANYACTIGGGGPASSNGTNGTNSTFASLTAAVGGGSGGGWTGNAPGNGGSGGGSRSGAGGTSTQTGTGATAFYGNAGATASNFIAGGGGGGAGAAGTAGTADYVGGNGGNGVTAFSSWGSATGTGENISGTYYYAGGGAGYASNIGGYGGGGNNTRASGVANTGGGGTTSGSGGSGIVIIRYPMAS